MLKAITAKAALKSARELAKGIEFSRVGAKRAGPPWRSAACLTEEDAQAIRDKYRIVVEGEHLPPPVVDFEQTRAPRSGVATSWPPRASPARRPSRCRASP